ncbi:MAG: ankyrin repeat domain-containing protein [Phycisphaerales bacterium]|nr:ankyrin repeat domain-containing protein [Phycisphaerales bacterium]
MNVGGVAFFAFTRRDACDTLEHGQWASRGRMEDGARSSDEHTDELIRAVQDGASQQVGSILTRLLSAGAAPAGADAHGDTALHWACRLRNAPIATLLVIHAAPLDSANDLGETPLHIAAATGAAELVDLLVEFGADVNAADSAGRTPLHVAADANQLEAVRSLLRTKASVDARDVNGNTPLHAAANAHWGEANTRIVRRTLSPETRRDLRDAGHHDNPARAAFDNVAIVNALVKAGAPVDAENYAQETPLHRAARGDSAGAVTALLAAGADPGARNAWGRQPRDVAASLGHYRAAAILQRAEAARGGERSR